MMITSPLNAADLESHLRKYSPGAYRYACYPTQECFAPGFDASDLSKAIERRRSQAGSRSLALVINAPGRPQDLDADAPHLVKEAALQRALLGRRESTSQFHLAAGDARGLRLETVAGLLERLEAEFVLPPREVCSIEIHAGAGSELTLRGLAALGFDRVCLTTRGTATLEHGIEAATEAIERARSAGIPCVGAEIRYGLPGQTAARFALSLDLILGARPHSVTLSEHWSAGAARSAERASLLACAIERLLRAGYEYVGLDVYELPGSAPRAGASGSTRPRRPHLLHGRTDVLGLGPGAVSAVGDCYSQNAAAAQDCAAAVAAGKLPVARGLRMVTDDLLRREVIHALECEFSVSFSALEFKYGVDFAPYFAAELARLEDMQEDGIVELYADAIEVTPEGRPLVRAASALFDRYLRPRLEADAAATGSGA